MNVTAKLFKVKKSIPELIIELNGNSSPEKRYFEALPGLVSKVSTILYSMYGHNSDVPGFQVQSFDLAKKQFGPEYEKVKQVDESLKAIQKKLEDRGLPHIKGSLPAYDRNL